MFNKPACKHLVPLLIFHLCLMLLFGCEDQKGATDFSTPVPRQLLDSIKSVQTEDPAYAMQMTEAVITIAKEEGDTLTLQEALIRKATIFEIDSEVDSALVVWKLLFSEYPDMPSELYAKALTNFGLLEFRLGNLQQAKINLQKVKKIWIEQEHVSGIITANQNLSAIYFEARALDSAALFAKNALALSQSIQDTSAIGYALTALSGIYSDMGKYDLAKQYLNQSIQWNSSRNQIEIYTYDLLNLAVLFERKNLSDSAFFYYAVVDSIARKRGYSDLLIRSLFNQSFLQNELGNSDAAFHFMDQAVFLEDSLKESRHASELAELQVKYGTARKEAQIAVLEQQKDRSRSRLVAISIGSILTLIACGFIIFFLRYRIRITKALNQRKLEQLEKEKQVDRLESIVITQEKERKRIARDLHDDIGSLLSTAIIQLSRVKNLELLEKIKPIVFSAESTIRNVSTEIRRVAHDMMPSTLLKLGLVDGIEDFLEKIKEGDNTIEVEFKFQKFTERLKEEREIMIYRIVQELVQNTLKHSGATQISLKFEIVDSFITLHYTDNGRGFSLANTEEGIGLENINGRVAYLKATMIFKSEENEGVSYKIKIPKYESTD